MTCLLQSVTPLLSVFLLILGNGSWLFFLPVSVTGVFGYHKYEVRGSPTLSSSPKTFCCQDCCLQRHRQYVLPTVREVCSLETSGSLSAPSPPKISFLNKHRKGYCNMIHLSVTQPTRWCFVSYSPSILISTLLVPRDSENSFPKSITSLNSTSLILLCPVLVMHQSNSSDFKSPALDLYLCNWTLIVQCFLLVIKNRSFCLSINFLGFYS